MKKGNPSKEGTVGWLIEQLEEEEFLPGHTYLKLDFDNKIASMARVGIDGMLDMGYTPLDENLARFVL